MSAPTKPARRTGSGPHNPYVGPRPFTSKQQLPNRALEAQDVADLLASERVLLLQAASGAGKTSLIQAGVLERMRGFKVAGPVRVDKPVPRRPDGRPVRLRNRYVHSIALYLMAESLDPESLYNMTLADVLRAGFNRIEGDGVPLLIIDQFEEILTLDPTDHEAKEAFFEELGSCVEDLDGTVGLWVLLAIRDDAIGALDPFSQFVPGYLRSRYRLSFLTPNEAQAAIQRPADAQGVTISDAAALELIRRLARTRVRSAGLASAESLPTSLVEPLQLQVLCRRLWKDMLVEKGRFDRIELRDVTSLPDDYVERALSRYYSDSVTELAKQFDIDEQAVRDWFETALITEHGDRSQSTRGPVTEEHEQEVLNRLKDMFLINSDTRGETTWYELAHDRLVNAVRVANRAWRYSNLDAWQLAALDWKQSNRHPSLLLDPRILPYRWRSGTPLEEEFREACMQHFGTKFRIGRWKLLTGVLAMFIVLQSAAIIWLLVRYV